MRKLIIFLSMFILICPWVFSLEVYDNFDDNNVDFTTRWMGEGGYWSQSNTWGLTEFNNNILRLQAYGSADTGTDQGKYVTKENVKGKDWELKIFGDNECENSYDPDRTGVCTGPNSGPAIHVILTSSKQSFVGNTDLYTQKDIVYSGGYYYEDNPTWDHIELSNNVVIKGRWEGNNLVLDFCYGGTDGMQTCSNNNKTITGLTADTYYVGFQGCGYSSGSGDITTKGATLCTDFLKIGTESASCTESWSCTSWSACTNGQQTRTCTDANNCGTTASKPSMTQSCTCTESWTCGSWSTCSGSTQTRTCTDSNSCGTTVSKPATTQTCTIACTESWTCTDWSGCVNNQQTRTCTDANNCGTTNNKPIVTQSCKIDVKPPVSTSVPNVLAKGVDGVVNGHDGQLVFEISNEDTNHKLEGYLSCNIPSDVVVTSSTGAASGSQGQYISETFTVDTAPDRKSMNLGISSQSTGSKLFSCTVNYVLFKEGKGYLSSNGDYSSEKKYFTVNVNRDVNFNTEGTTEPPQEIVKTGKTIEISQQNVIWGLVAFMVLLLVYLLGRTSRSNQRENP